MSEILNAGLDLCYSKMFGENDPNDDEAFAIDEETRYTLWMMMAPSLAAHCLDLPLDHHQLYQGSDLQEVRHTHHPGGQAVERGGEALVGKGHSHH